jgi:hypothetical protein
MTICSEYRRPSWHASYLAMLPTIERYATMAFAHLDAEAREDRVQSVIGNTFVAYARLAQLGKLDIAYPSALARYAVAQVRAGRRLGSCMNANDVLSEHARRHKGVKVRRLEDLSEDQDQEGWKQVVLEDHRTPVPDQAAFRIDFAAWLDTHTDRRRRIAQALAVGHSTTEVSRKFGVSAGRISQMRRKFARSWRRFHGEEDK